MSFWDSHEVSSGGGYLSAEEKDALVKSGASFDITGVRFEPENKYGPRYVITFTLPNPTTGDPETRMLGFVKGSGVTSRDDILEAMIVDHFGAGETEPIPAILDKGGNAFLIKPASS